MSQKSWYVLFGHGHPLQKGNLTLVPDNGTMIKMIPGTCTPMRALELSEYAMRLPNTPPDELVEILNRLESDIHDHPPAFRIYEPASTYSDSRIVIEDAKLFHYDFNDANIGTYDFTDLLHKSITRNTDPNCFPLSSVNRYLARLGEPYILVVLACMQTDDPKTNQDVEDLLSSGHSIEEVHKMVKDIGYHGGKKSRMIKRSMRKKRRRNRKTTQHHATKRR